MSTSGLRQWFPRGRWLMAGIGVYQVTFIAWQLRTVDGLLGQLTGVALALAAVTIISSSLSYRVRADDDGLHVRGAWWRTRFLPWSEVADIRPRRDRPRSPLVVVPRSGRRVTTALRTVDHPSLVSHWRVMTGRASLIDYAAYADHLDHADAGYAGSR